MLNHTTKFHFIKREVFKPDMTSSWRTHLSTLSPTRIDSKELAKPGTSCIKSGLKTWSWLDLQNDHKTYLEL